MAQIKKLIWVGTSLRDLKEFPNEVKDEIGFALHQVQMGGMPLKAKPFKGMGAGVMEIICDFDTNTYRAVYAVKIGNDIYVLHSFQKKSKSGIKTPQKEVELIRKRLNTARELATKGRK